MNFTEMVTCVTMENRIMFPIETRGICTFLGFQSFLLLLVFFKVVPS